MPAYDKKAAKKSKAFKRFKRYVLRGKRYPKKEQLRYFFSKAEGTVKVYTKIIRGYVKYMHIRTLESFFSDVSTARLSVGLTIAFYQSSGPASDVSLLCTPCPGARITES